MSCGKAVQDSHLPEVALEHRLSGGQIEEPESQHFGGEVLQRQRRVHAGVYGGTDYYRELPVVDLSCTGDLWPLVKRP